jgi:hypothetical protein
MDGLRRFAQAQERREGELKIWWIVPEANDLVPLKQLLFNRGSGHNPKTVIVEGPGEKVRYRELAADSDGWCSHVLEVPTHIDGICTLEAGTHFVLRCAVEETGTHEDEQYDPGLKTFMENLFHDRSAQTSWVCM